jgi:serine/threonine protein kinase/tetratricopeptide (TPR) repeat protein
MIGKRLSHFKILAKLGEGGMGVVYRAEDENLGREVALKVLPPESMGSEQKRLRFLREARTAAAVTHPNIATIHEIDEADGVVFIAMQLVEGSTLSDRIDGKPLPTRDALKTAIEIAEALAAAHQANVIHRDLKPDNVIVGPDGHVKILDFGLAKLHEDAAAVSSEEAARMQTISAGMTQDGKVMGTAAYMSPEQARGLKVDKRSDLFAFGIVLYETITGRKPFFGATATDTMSAILRDTPAPATEINTEVPHELERIIYKCLEKNPDDRYQHADEIVVDLRRLRRQTDSETVPVVSGTTVHPPVNSRPWWRKPVPLALAAVAIVAAGVLGVKFLGSPTLTPATEAGVESLAVLPLENLKDREDPERLGRILQELIITDLSGVDSLRVFSSQRLYDIRKQIGNGTASAIDQEVATEVARRAGAQTMLTGSLSQLGEQWILACQLVNVADGSVIKSERIDGADLYSMVDNLTLQIRDDLGLGETTAGQVAVGEKTTSSMEAMKHYVAGVEHLNERKLEEAVGELSKAVEIDPAFGQAHYKLAIATWWYGGDSGMLLPEGQQRGDEILENLLASDVKLSPKERKLAEAFVPIVKQQYADARPLFEDLVREFPHEKEAWYGLGEARYHVPGGTLSLEAVEAFQKALDMDPSFRLAYMHIADVYEALRMVDEGLALTRRILDANQDDPSWYREWIRWLVLKGDSAEMDAGIAEALDRTRDASERRDLLVNLGWTLREMEAYDDAERYLRQSLEFYVDGDDSEPLKALGWVLLSRKRDDEAERRFREALVMKPLDPGTQNGLFQVLTRQRRFDEAVNVFRGIVDAHPDNLRVYDFWIKSALLGGDDAEVRRAIDNGLEHCRNAKQKAYFWLRVSWAYNEVENHVEHLAAAKTAVEALGGEYDSQVHLVTAWAYHSVRDLDESEKWFLEILDRDGINGSALNGLVQLEIERERPAAARDYAQRLIDAVPGDTGPRGLIAFTLAAGGDVQGARRAVDEGLELARTGKDKRELLVNAAWGAVYHRDYKSAEEFCRRAVALDPAKTGRSRSQLAVIRLFQGRLDDAARLIAEELRADPHNDDAERFVALLRLTRGDLTGAEEKFRELLDSGPGTASAAKDLGILLAELGRYDEAARLARRALDMSPQHSHYALLAWTLVAGGIDLEEGERLARKALDTVPSVNDRMVVGLEHQPVAEQALGLALLERGQYDEAVDRLEKAAKISPNRQSIQQNLKRARARK